jgi:hypothetical protein
MVTAMYDRYPYGKEKRAALEKWAEVLFRIVDVKPAPTKPLARRVARAIVYEFSPRRRDGHGSACTRPVACVVTHSA